jgi:hypothetical protein
MIAHSEITATIPVQQRYNNYSQRSAAIGSARAARRAGK